MTDEDVKPDINKAEFPPNSNKSRLPIAKEGQFLIDQPKTIQKVVTGKVTRRKKSFIDNFAETFFGGDSKTVATYVLWDVLIPAVKNTITEMVKTGVEMLLFGDSTPSDRLRRDRGRTIVNYGGFSRPSFERRGVQEPLRNRARHKFDDIVIETRGEAEEVLSSLVDQIETYDVATVADFYDLVGITSDFTDHKWGWDNLSTAVIERVRDGYILVMPRTIPLE